MVKKRITDLGLLVLLCSSGIKAKDNTSLFGADGSGTALPSDESPTFAALSGAGTNSSTLGVSSAALSPDSTSNGGVIELVDAAKGIVNVTETTLAHCLHVMAAAAQADLPGLEQVFSDLKGRFDSGMSDVAQVVAADLAAAKIKVAHVKAQIANYADVANRRVVCDRIETNLRYESSKLHGALVNATPEAADALRVQTRKVDDLLANFIAQKPAIVGKAQNGSNLLDPAIWGNAAYLGAGVVVAGVGFAAGRFTK